MSRSKAPKELKWPCRKEKNLGYLLLQFLWMWGQMNHKHRNTCKVHPERNFLLIIGFYCSLISFADRYFQLYLPLSFHWQTHVTQQWYWCPWDKTDAIDHCFFTNAFARSEVMFKTTVLTWKAIATCYSQGFSVFGDFIFTQLHFFSTNEIIVLFSL